MGKNARSRISSPLGAVRLIAVALFFFQSFVTFAHAHAEHDGEHEDGHEEEHHELGCEICLLVGVDTGAPPETSETALVHHDFAILLNAGPTNRLAALTVSGARPRGPPVT